MESKPSNQTANIILRLKGITKDYKDGSGSVTKVLRGVDLDLKQSSTVAITGPSGCGKSTLLNIIGALDKPTSGSIEIKGKNYFEMDENELAVLRNKQIGFIFQFHHLLPHCSALENVMIPALADPSSEIEQKEERAIMLLKNVGLSNCLHKKPGSLSGGERQKVAFARALINSPSILLADEPTGSLDKYSADSLLRLMIEINKTENTALVVVTHSDRIAGFLEDRKELADGKLK